MRRLLGIVAAAALLAVLGPIALVEAHDPGKACEEGKSGSSREKNPHCNGHSNGQAAQSNSTDFNGGDAKGNGWAPKCNGADAEPGGDCDDDDIPNQLDPCDTQQGPAPCTGDKQDADADGVRNGNDNCDSTWNPYQENFNHKDDDEGDACDSDIDGDNVPNAVDSNDYDTTVPLNP